jgi:manganese oxidase
VSTTLPATRPGNLLLYAAALSLLAAVIHLRVMPEHFEEWWGYGAFFLVCAAAQVVYVPILLRWPARPVLLIGVAGNLAVVILWLVTRTAGIPFFGPHAGDVEEIGALDLTCTLAEVGLVAVLGALAMRGLATQGRLQIVVVLAVSALFLWHLLHLLAGSSSH